MKSFLLLEDGTLNESSKKHKRSLGFTFYNPLTCSGHRCFQLVGRVDVSFYKYRYKMLKVKQVL